MRHKTVAIWVPFATIDFYLHNTHFFRWRNRCLDVKNFKMAALSCRSIFNSCFLLHPMQRRLVTKLATDQDVKKEKKRKKMEARKEM